MPHTNRMRNAFVASLLINVAAIAWVGSSDLVHPRKAASRPSAAAALHPVPIKVATAKDLPVKDAESGGQDREAGGPSDASDGPGRDRGNSGADGSAPNPRKPNSNRGGSLHSANQRASGDTADRSEQSATKDDSPNDLRLRSKSRQEMQLAAAQKRRLAAVREQQIRTAITTMQRNGTPLTPAQQDALRREMQANQSSAQENRQSMTASTRLDGDPQRDALLHGLPGSSMGKPDGAPQGDPSQSAAGNPPSGKPGSNSSVAGSPPKGMHEVTTSSAGGKNAKVGDRGDSIARKMVKYPKMKVDLGTIHMTRPKHGVTGGGSADMRNVDITANFKIDDPNNIPKNLKPNKVVKMFPSKCDADPGNKSKCVPTGGNTILGGTVLHGKNHLTGLKYCVPGAPGIPGASGNAKNAQSAERHVGGSRSPTDGRTAEQSGGVAAALSGSYSDPAIQTNTTPLHLPAAHGNFKDMVPGAKVPEPNRSWVYNPEAHTDVAPPGKLPAPMPRFTLYPRSVGSTSKYGTVEWQMPHRVRHKKKPLGGDGSGLLGMYYLGNDFQQLVMTRPDRNIDFDWSSRGPDPRVLPQHEYSVRWIGKLVPQVTDTYTIATASDDGERVYVDGRLLISNWTVHAATEDTATIYLEAGHEYDIKVEYFENAYGPAVMRLYWESPHQPRQYIPEQCLRYPKSLVKMASLR